MLSPCSRLHEYTSWWMLEHLMRYTVQCHAVKTEMLWEWRLSGLTWALYPPWQTWWPIMVQRMQIAVDRHNAEIGLKGKVAKPAVARPATRPCFT